MRQHQKLAILVAIIMATVLGGATLLASTTPTPTASGTASPNASPDASPDASPIGSPEASPVGSPDSEPIVGNAEAGKLAAVQCLGCHSIDGSTMVGPSWKGIYGETVELEDGTTEVIDVDYLTQSIKDPMSQIVKGFPAAMPPYSYLTDEQVNDLIAYIASLSED